MGFPIPVVDHVSNPVGGGDDGDDDGDDGDGVGNSDGGGSSCSDGGGGGWATSEQRSATRPDAWPRALRRELRAMPKAVYRIHVFGKVLF